MGKKREKHTKRSRKDGTYEEKNYKLQPKESKLFEEYYKRQGIVEDEDWESFMAALLRPLPCTFRVTSFKSHCSEMLEIVKQDYINDLLNNDITKKEASNDVNENNEVNANGKEKNANDDDEDNDTKDFKPDPPKCLSWYPGGYAWQLNLDRKALRVDARLKRMHKFLVEETESGFISRQEAVSMIPPTLLAVKPGHKVLDMCAAPGSKTAQLIEMLHHGASEHDQGFVVANDTDNKRCYLMVHQLNRLLSEKYVVVNCDASNMSSFSVSYNNNNTKNNDNNKDNDANKNNSASNNNGDTGKSDNNNNNNASTVNEGSDDKAKVIKFDRILCDVPCSGDGTLRKNVDAWHRWNPGAAHGLHNLQRRIAKRGVELLVDGGLMVYSTCSFNPVENEAVVAWLLNHFKASLELVDVRDQLPGLKVQSGMTEWKVMTKLSEWFSSFEEVPKKLVTQLVPTLFPCENIKQLHINKCIRILPHHQDTGGFFVALFRKKAVETLPKQVAAVETAEQLAEEETEVEAVDKKAAVDDEGEKMIGDSGEKKRKSGGDDGRPAKKVKQWGYKEDPFIFLQHDDDQWKPLREFYGIDDSFNFGQLMVRCEGGKKRNMYYVSEAVKKLVLANQNRFKFINMGVKMFSRSVSKDVSCDFRIVQDGTHILFPHVSERVLHMNCQDIITLLTTENPYIDRFAPETQKALNDLSQGGCIYVYRPKEGQEGPTSELVLSGWKGKVSCRTFLPKADRGHYLRLCGVEAGLDAIKTQISDNSKANDFDEVELDADKEAVEQDVVIENKMETSDNNI